MPSFKPSEYITPGVEVLECSNADTSKLDNGLVRITRKYTLTSFDENLYYIPPMKVKVDGKEYQSKSLALKVLTVPVDTLHPEKFYPPKGVQDNPFLWSEWEQAFWLSVIFVLVCVLTYYLWTRLKENKPVIAQVRIIKKIPPHQKALKEIERIKDDRMSVSEDQKAYYTLLTDVLRKYIKARFGFNAMEMTSSQIIKKLLESNERDALKKLNDVLDTADLVKFAKYNPMENENDMNLISAVAFINNTRVEIPEDKKEKPKDIVIEEPRSKKAKEKLLYGIIGISTVLCIVISLLAYEIYKLFV